jgi:hypothetical protein
MVQTQQRYLENHPKDHQLNLGEPLHAGGMNFGEAVRNLLVGHEGLIGLLRSKADQGNAQIVRQKADHPLFSKGAGGLRVAPVSVAYASPATIC